MFAQSGAHLLAVDISPDLAERARKRNLSQSQVQFPVRRYEDCTVDGPFDAVIGSSPLHHLPCPRRILAEAASCVQPGGAVVMIDPWVTPWSRLVYSRLHDEPFQVDAEDWEFPRGGPLSDADSALPYIIFVRDRLRFQREFPMWRVAEIKPVIPFRYLVSGGASLRRLTPGWTLGLWRR